MTQRTRVTVVTPQQRPGDRLPSRDLILPQYPKELHSNTGNRLTVPHLLRELRWRPGVTAYGVAHTPPHTWGFTPTYTPQSPVDTFPLEVTSPTTVRLGDRTIDAMNWLAWQQVVLTPDQDGDTLWFTNLDTVPLR